MKNAVQLSSSHNLIEEHLRKRTYVDDSDILLTREEAAKFLNYKPITLAIWKSTKRYPLPCLKIGKSIRYKLSDLKKFIEDNLHQ